MFVIGESMSRMCLQKLGAQKGEISLASVKVVENVDNHMLENKENAFQVSCLLKLIHSLNKMINRGLVCVYAFRTSSTHYKDPAVSVHKSQDCGNIQKPACTKDLKEGK
jgi:hypothetical protein